MDTTSTSHDYRNAHSRGIGPSATVWPHRLIDHVLVCEQIRNDAELSRVLRLVPSVISKIRHGHSPVSAEVILRMHEAFDIPIAELKRLDAAHLVLAPPRRKVNP